MKTNTQHATEGGAKNLGIFVFKWFRRKFVRDEYEAINLIWKRNISKKKEIFT